MSEKIIFAGDGIVRPDASCWRDELDTPISDYLTDAATPTRKQPERKQPEPNASNDKRTRYTPPPCPKCGGPVKVRSTRKDRRYLVCKDGKCGHTWTERRGQK